jgi:hypothetical protein
MILSILVIEIAHVRSEALKNTTLHRNCMGCKGLKYMKFPHTNLPQYI